MRKGVLDTYHIGDARDIASLLPQEEFVDVTVTSPPYWNLKDYRSPHQVGFGQQYDDYLDSLKKVFAAIYKVTKKTGSLWIVADTVKHNGELKLLPFDLATSLKEDGWTLHDIIIWHKDKTLPWSHRGKLRNIFEYILFFSKDKKFKYNISRVRETEGLKDWWTGYPERYSPLGKAPTRTWSIPIPRQGSWGENWVRHFCPLPPKLVRRIILLTTSRGDVVLDPFAGSGVVLAQAKASGRRFVGIDLRKTYRRMFEKKVLPSIIALEREAQKSQQGDTRNRRAFSSLIWRLRKTKYPRELVRLYAKLYGDPHIRAVLALSPGPRRLNLHILLARSNRTPQRLLTRMKTLTARPPLSKYGLRINVSAMTVDDTQARLRRGRAISPGTKLAIYKNGRTNRAAGERTVRDLLDSLRQQPNGSANSYPVIASNIRVGEHQEMLDPESHRV